MPKVNPAILRWARETAGLSEDEAAAKVDLRDARGLSAVERLRALEGGTDTPSRSLLVRMAKQYRRPLIAFYLAAPPPRGDRGQDFRTLPHDEPPDDEPLLDALIRDVQARQSLIRSALLDDEEVKALPFVGSLTMGDGVETVTASLRALLGITLDEYRQSRDVDEAFRKLRSRAEEAGVFVLLLGNLGSHHTNIDVDTFRGLALADDVAPFLVINDQDHHAAWSFTLVHELVHLVLGQTGVSGGRPEQAVERFCNEVASEFLLPRQDLRELTDLAGLGVEDVAERISSFARERMVSHSMVAYKLFSQHLITRAMWVALNQSFRAQWLSERERRRERAREAEGGPNYYLVRRHRLGPALLETTAHLMASGLLTTSKASAVLGVKLGNVQELVAGHQVRAF